MHGQEYLNYNGKIFRADKLLISPNNRSFRYGDGFFETMKMVNGKIALADYHFERMFRSLEILLFEKPATFTKDALEQAITSLAQKNGHSRLARVRLMIFRGDGGLHDAVSNTPEYLIQTWPLNPAIKDLNENGLVTGIFTRAGKACDDYSPIKSNNYLPYVMAALWAKAARLNDAILLNSHGRIADATIANVFIIKDGIVKTPALAEGCVEGVMRRHLLQCLRAENIPVEETMITTDDLLQAGEMFLTNSVYGLKWVKQCNDSNYVKKMSALFHRKYILNAG
ncbi:aminotransferase class IV [Panacibacter sp. DH6]|uniref:branched-chain-amino-acid transaminase n=1 Tax=Panacibacter microcysteis TaxID=2793269 RepID=A0A931E3G7_9BACT|nr:aminotransferase class IV [Panacibacter microcysteis]MBG9376905.1 aminotransferase class IV [Panacibacter microcysteis]